MRIRTLTLVAFACVATTLGCGDRGPDVTVSVSNPMAAEGVDHGQGLIGYAAPAESLLVHEPGAAGRSTQLVFHRGRGVDRDDDGRAYLPEPLTSRVLVTDGLSVAGVLGGPSSAAGALTQPLSVTPIPGGGALVTDAETAPGLLYYDADGEFTGASAPPVTNAEIRSGQGGSVWAARSPYVLRFDETEADAPLLYRFDPMSGDAAGVATIEPATDPSWNRVANAGAIAVDQDGNAYFSFFLRNELRAYSPDGDLRWRTTRDLGEAYAPGADGSLRPVTQALAFGPDGLLYALTVPDSLPDIASAGPVSSGTRRVEVYDPATGALIRAASIPAGWNTLGVDRWGAVFHLDPDAIEETAPTPLLRPLPQVPLVTFDGDSARFTDWEGQAMLVNFWASWCVPCQRELPQLAAFYQTLDQERVEFLAISVDETRGAAIDFIQEFDLPFPTFYGGLEMQGHFGFFGLPYTIVVDSRGFIVEESYGFGNPESWEYLKTRVLEEIARVATDPETLPGAD